MPRQVKPSKRHQQLLRSRYFARQKLGIGNGKKQSLEVLTRRAVPVCSHRFNLPQSVNIFSGFLKFRGAAMEAGDQLLAMH